MREQDLIECLKTIYQAQAIIDQQEERIAELEAQVATMPVVVGYISIFTAHKLRSGANLCATILQTAGKHHSVAVYLGEKLDGK